MNFTIIEYNIHYKVKRNLFLLTYLLALFLSIFREELQFLKYVLLSAILLWAVYQLFVKTYKVIGKYSINYKNEIHICNKSIEYRIKISELDSISFYYGGYSGEAYEIGFFFSGSFLRDGTKNYLKINQNKDNKLQILLKNKEDANYIISFIDSLKETGVHTELIKYNSFPRKLTLSNK
jgi:hypothetical protein